ncbi:CHAT domain-containing protein [Variovorax rhizosphaerae]|uniref:CHAT domain-containing protein n=1 Tax=Variovorax rhizosphaerae TaxID=1836200 RepID=A0ABU8WPR9_9BURK
MQASFKWVAAFGTIGAMFVLLGCAAPGAQPEATHQEAKTVESPILRDIRLARNVQSTAADSDPGKSKPLFVYPLELESNHHSVIEKNNEGIALHAKGNVHGAEEAYTLARAALIANAHPNDLAALKVVPRDRTQSDVGKAMPIGAAAYDLGEQLSRVESNIGIAKWAQNDRQGALSHFRTALELRDQLEGSDEKFISDRAFMARNDDRLLESSVLLSLEGSLGESADSNSLAIEMVFQRKGALLDRQTQSMTQIQNQALPQGPAAPPSGLDVTDALLPALDKFNSVSGFLTYLGPAGAAASSVGGIAHSLLSIGADAREKRRAAERVRREDDKKFRVESQEMLDERSAIMRQRSQSHDSKEIARLDAREQSLELQIRMRASEATPAPTPRTPTPEVTPGRSGNVRPSAGAWLKSVQQRIPEGAVLLEMFTYVPVDPRAPMALGTGQSGRPAAAGANTAARVDQPATQPQIDALRVGPTHYGVYVISRKGPPVRIDFGEAQRIDERIVELRNALARPNKINGARAKARELDELLMRPVRSVIGATPLLLVAPEGLLNLVPLGALVDEQDRYLVERFAISYLSSGRDLLRARSDAPRRDKDLIVADPAFDAKPVQLAVAVQEGVRGTRSRDFSDKRFEALPGTALEAAAIKQLLPEARVLTGTAATETVVKQIHGPRILHVATHGFFLPDQGATPDAQDRREEPMLRSGLVFANVNTGGTETDDGVLTALEASSVDLLGTRLVVLSACETGVGTVKNGEGVFGMRRAFVVAGAETLLMTLWPIADDATQQLMSDYYDSLKQGSGRADALRKAQLRMLSKKETGHPFFWAGFISSGDWTSLAFN